jgi:YD repeat-containing protein
MALIAGVGLPAHAEDESAPKQDEKKGGATTLSRVTARAPSMFTFSGGGGGGAGGSPNFGRSERRHEFELNRGEQETKSDPDASTPCDSTDDGLLKGNPINIATGNKVQPELDFATEGEMGLFLQRTYNHHWDGVGLFGWKWLSNLDYRLSFGSSYHFGVGVCYARPSIAQCATIGAPESLWAHRPDGRKLKFIRGADGVYYENKAAPVARIVRQSDGRWVHYTEDNRTETYSNGGYPERIASETGVAWTFSYGGLQGTQLQRVTHSSGRAMALVWGTGTWDSDELKEVRDPAGNAYRFAYAHQKAAVGIHLLQSVTLPGAPATVVSYHYTGEAGEPDSGGYGLTGKSFNGARYSYFAYSPDGRYATRTEHAGAADRYQFTYTQGADNLLTVEETNPLDKRATYVFKNGKPLTVTGHPSNQCAGAYRESTYDSNGYPDLVADFNANFTNYDYAANGQLLNVTQAFNTPLAQTTHYVWDAANRVTRETLPDGVTVDYAYTTGNRLQSVRVTGGGQSQTTTYAYTLHGNGLLATAIIDGPLPGSGDSVSYVYDAMGQLTSVRNGVGHEVVYSHHNALGQPGRVTGANGEMTDFGYDSRGRMTLVRNYVNGAVADTRYSYGAAGLLASSTTPEGVVTTYHYDAARRLIAESQLEYDGRYARKHYGYNAMSLPTVVTVDRSDAPPASPLSNQPAVSVYAARSAAAPMSAATIPTSPPPVTGPSDAVWTVNERPQLRSPAGQYCPPGGGACLRPLSLPSPTAGTEPAAMQGASP